MIKYCISIIYECVRCKNWYEFDFDLFLNVVIYIVCIFIFIFIRIYFFFLNYILLVEYLMVVSIVWILIGICKKED